jgi:transcription initiation factor TFIIIB Brf1 subunit/transcription initiation factor TFIIB
MISDSKGLMGDNLKECNHDSTEIKGIYLICLDCSEVLEINKFVEQSHRAYSQEELEEKCHINVITDHLSERRTIFNINDVRDWNKSTFGRLDKKDRWVSDRKYVRMMEAKVAVINYLNTAGIGGNKNLNKELEYILRRTGDYNLQGKNMSTYAAAILVYLLRLFKIPQNTKSLTDHFNITKNMMIFNMLNDIISRFKLKRVSPISLDRYVEWYMNEMGTEHKINDVKMTKMVREGKYYSAIMESLGNGKSVICNAAGIIYFLIKDYNVGNITQDDISERLGVTTVSLRRAKNDLEDLIYE